MESPRWAPAWWGLIEPMCATSADHSDLQSPSLSRRGFLHLLGMTAAAAGIPPYLTARTGGAAPPAAHVFRSPLEGQIEMGYRHFDATRDAAGRPDGGHHIGIDLNLADGDVDEGVAVRTIADGVCVFAADTWWGCGLGRMVILRHVLPDGSQIYSRFAHLQRVDTKPGAVCSRGEVLGRLGRSGCQRSAHLHLDLALERTWETYLLERPWYYPYRAPRWWLKQYFLDPDLYLPQEPDPAWSNPMRVRRI